MYSKIESLESFQLLCKMHRYIKYGLIASYIGLRTGLFGRTEIILTDTDKIKYKNACKHNEIIFSEIFYTYDKRILLNGKVIGTSERMEMDTYIRPAKLVINGVEIKSWFDSLVDAIKISLFQ